MTETIIVVVVICVGILIAEAAVFAPEKMPWNRRRK